MNNTPTLPPCISCRNAWRAPQGYVRACALYLSETPLQMYGHCVEAAINGRCEQYVPMSSKQSDQPP